MSELRAPRAEPSPDFTPNEVVALVAVEAAARLYAKHSHGNLSGPAYRAREDAKDGLLDAIAHLDLVRQNAGVRT